MFLFAILLNTWMIVKIDLAPETIRICLFRSKVAHCRHEKPTKRPIHKCIISIVYVRSISIMETTKIVTLSMPSIGLIVGFIQIVTLLTPEWVIELIEWSMKHSIAFVDLAKANYLLNDIWSPLFCVEKLKANQWKFLKICRGEPPPNKKEKDCNFHVDKITIELWTAYRLHFAIHLFQANCISPLVLIVRNQFGNAVLFKIILWQSVEVV